MYRSIQEFAEGGQEAQEELERSVVAAAPERLSQAGADFTGRLLHADENQRLGSGANGFLELMKHPWLETTDWEAFLRRQVKVGLSLASS